MTGGDSDEHPPPARPSAIWRAVSRITTTAVGGLSCAYLYGFSKLEVYGLDDFVKILDARWDLNGRQRGLITGMDGA